MRHTNIRCIAFIVSAALGLGTLVCPKTVVAESRRCAITPTSPALFFFDDTSGKESVQIIARWNGVVHCEASTPFEGAAVEITQQLGAVFGTKGKVNGTTQIVIEFTGAGIRRSFAGRINGLLETGQSSIGVSGVARTQGAGGSQLELGFRFLIDAGTNELLDYEPGVGIFSYDHDLEDYAI